MWKNKNESKSEQVWWQAMLLFQPQISRHLKIHSDTFALLRMTKSNKKNTFQLSRAMSGEDDVFRVVLRRYNLSDSDGLDRFGQKRN